jgi:hypothetical protein
MFAFATRLLGLDLGSAEPEKFPRYLLITGAVVEPLDHVAE